MSKFLVHYEGVGDGCDYTIGCNHAVGIFDEPDMAAAVARVTDKLREDGELLPEDRLRDGYRIETVTIYEIKPTVHVVDLKRLRSEGVQQAAVDAQGEAQAKDRAEYERLKAKFEGPK
jgi:hypothetical protein